MPPFSIENGSTGSEVSIITSEKVNSKKFNLSYSIQPIYYFSRIFGLMPIKLVYDSNGSINGARIIVTGVLWSIISIGLHMYVAIHFSLHVECTKGVTSIILANGTKTIVMLHIVFNCLCIMMELCNCFKLADILKKLNSFDEEASRCFEQLLCFISDYFLFFVF